MAMVWFLPLLFYFWFLGQLVTFLRPLSGSLHVLHRLSFVVVVWAPVLPSDCSTGVSTVRGPPLWPFSSSHFALYSSFLRLFVKHWHHWLWGHLLEVLHSTSQLLLAGTQIKLVELLNIVRILFYLDTPDTCSSILVFWVANFDFLCSIWICLCFSA